MTRYTKLERKRHVDASESFAVTPLMPSKAPQATTPTPAASAPASKKATETAPPKESKDPQAPTQNEGKKTGGKKRKAGSSESGESKADGEATGGATAGPSKKAKTKKNKNSKGPGQGQGQGKDGEGKPGQFGHSAKNCKESSGVGMCYSCGSLEHMTQDCKKLSKDGNKFKFATCFVCKEQGHLAGQCPKNERGLYPNGGSCRFCNKVDHLAKDCKLTKEEVGTVTLGKIDLVQGADDDDFHIFVDEKRKLTEEQKTIKRMIKAPVKAPKKVVSF
ncbi:hypothetical protein EDD11_002854 [Mortierella claussenii]|nr:hypothetical protein EDD11_002854 [Mortierella claussenii]